jgi:hypothetical protein
LAWLGLAWLGLVWLGLAWLGLAWLGLAWSGVAWLGLAWLGLTWLGLAWSGVAWLGFAWCFSFSTIPPSLLPRLRGFIGTLTYAKTCNCQNPTGRFLKKKTSIVIVLLYRGPRDLSVVNVSTALLYAASAPLLVITSKQFC